MEGRYCVNTLYYHICGAKETNFVMGSIENSEN